MSQVSPLRQFGRGDLLSAGGKGANLGELIRAGLPVPEGFVVTTAAYRSFVEDNALQGSILRLAAPSSGVGTGARMLADVEAASGQIRELFTGAQIAGDLRRDVEAGYAALGSGPVAVRSSATAEDLVDASFAGQQDTYLNVSGVDALVQAIQRCWGSLWTARAITYRTRQGIDPADVSLAVVVQRLVDADAAGVMFTANPRTGRRSEIVIGAAWGLGESVVSGSVNTDDLVVAKIDGHVISRQVADKALMTVPVDGGTEERPVPDVRRRQPVLDDPGAAELARLGVRIERHFGAPQDIEWVRSGRAFTILQSRPITALPLPEADPPSEWPVPVSDAFYFRASIVEQLPDPLSPLFADLIDGSVTRSLTALMTEFFGGQALHPGDVGMPTVNGYAYYQYRRRALLRMTLSTPKALPVLVTGGRRSGLERWRNYSRPRYKTSSPDGPGGRSRSCPTGSWLLGCRTSWTPVPSTTPRSRPSSRSPRPARSSSPGSTPPWSDGPGTRRRPPSCSGSTACPSWPRSLSTTSRPGSAPIRG